MRLRLTRAARQDLISIAVGIAELASDPKVGRLFARQLRDQCEKLSALPGRVGRQRPELGPALRSFPFKSYVIVFAYEAETLVVVRIVHAHRDIGALFQGPER